MTLPLERIEGKYEIVAKLGEGGMGALYRVRHRLLDEPRVIKVVKSHFGDDEDLRRRLLGEARSAIRLRHPNVVQIFDFTVDDDGLGFLVMELIRGVDLRRLVASEDLPSVPLVLEMARQSLRALGFLHKSGYVHRDVAPDNLMLTVDVDGRPLIKMIDLGIAHRLDAEHQLTRSGAFVGKVRYASPEHFGDGGPEAIGPASDLYAFGLVLYELLTGTHPIGGETPSQQIAGHLFRAPRAFDEADPGGRVPAELRAVVLRALAKEPDRRFPDAGAFQRALVALQERMAVDGEVCAEAVHLARAGAEASLGAAESAEPGSTQERLDAGFVAEISRTVEINELDGTAPADAPPGGGGGGRRAERRRADARRYEAFLAEGCEHAEQGDYPAAVAAFEQARAIEPKNPMLEQLLAEARRHLAERTAAERAAAEITRLAAEGARLEADRRLVEAEERFGPVRGIL